MTQTELMAASTLIVRLERICSDHLLSHEEEMDTRQILCDAYRAFGFPSIAERRPLPSNVIDLDTAAQALVRREMSL